MPSTLSLEAFFGTLHRGDIDSTTPPSEPLIVVLGQGLVAHLAAFALARAGFSILRVSHSAAPDAGFVRDERTLALAKFSVDFLYDLGLWTELEADAVPIQSIHVSEQGRLAGTRLLAARFNLPAFGYVITHRKLGEVLLRSPWCGVRASNRGDDSACGLTSLTMPKVAIHPRREGIALEAVQGEHPPVGAALLIGADSVGSTLCQGLGVSIKRREHQQVALSFRLHFERPHAFRAYERFIPGGALALLPVENGAMGAIWTLPSPRAHEMLEASPAVFRHALQRAFGWRLGRVTEIGQAQGFGLFSSTVSRTIATRTVVIGSAANTLHPIGGQGFNLAVRDIATLVELLKYSHAQGHDLGSETLLENYAQRRRGDQRRMSTATRELNALFSSDSFLLRSGRGIGLLLFDLLPIAKRSLVKVAMGGVRR